MLQTKLFQLVELAVDLDPYREFVVAVSTSGLSCTARMVFYQMLESPVFPISLRAKIGCTNPAAWVADDNIPV